MCVQRVGYLSISSCTNLAFDDIVLPVHTGRKKVRITTVLLQHPGNMAKLSGFAILLASSFPRCEAFVTTQRYGQISFEKRQLNELSAAGRNVAPFQNWASENDIKYVQCICTPTLERGMLCLGCADIFSSNTEELFILLS